MRLFIIRHAKASRESATGRDHDRELTETGVRQAKFLGRELSDPGVDVVLSSTATRSRQTSLITPRPLLTFPVRKFL